MDRWEERKKLPRIHVVNVRNPPNITEILIESKKESTQAELVAHDEEVPDVESVDNYEEASANLINCDEETVDEEVQAVGEMLHLPDMKDNIDSDYDSDY